LTPPFGALRRKTGGWPESCGSGSSRDSAHRRRLADERLFEPSELVGREALAVVGARWGDDRAAVAGLDYRIGRTLLHQGGARDAEEILREGIALAHEADDDEVLTQNQINLAEALAHQGRYEEVRVIASEVLDRYEDGANQGQDQSSFEWSLVMEANRLSGAARLGMGDDSAAESLLHDTAQWFERRYPPDSWRRARAQSAWGECLVSLGRFNEAESILIESQEVLQAEVGSRSTATLDATRRLVRLDEAR